MIILAAIWENPAVVGLILAVPTTILGVGGWLLSKDRDAAVKDAGEDSGQATWAALILDDNATLRESVRLCNVRMDSYEVDRTRQADAIKRQADEIRGLHEEIARKDAEIGELKTRIGQLERNGTPLNGGPL